MGVGHVEDWPSGGRGCLFYDDDACNDLYLMRLSVNVNVKERGINSGSIFANNLIIVQLGVAIF